MASYTLDELETAVIDEYRSNSNFQKEVSKAIETKNQNRLSDLVKWVSDKIFGAVIESLIAAVIGALWNR